MKTLVDAINGMDELLEFIRMTDFAMTGFFEHVKNRYQRIGTFTQSTARCGWSRNRLARFATRLMRPWLRREKIATKRSKPRRTVLPPPSLTAAPLATAPQEAQHDGGLSSQAEAA